MNLLRSQWFESSFPGSEHACVEVRFAGDLVLIRDGKYLQNPANVAGTQPTIEIGLSAWDAFLEAALAPGTLTGPGVPRAERDDFGVTVSSGRTLLRYTAAEVAAFTAGIAAGEFTA